MSTFHITLRIIHTKLNILHFILIFLNFVLNLILLLLHYKYFFLYFQLDTLHASSIVFEKNLNDDLKTLLTKADVAAEKGAQATADMTAK